MTLITTIIRRKKTDKKKKKWQKKKIKVKEIWKENVDNDDENEN